MIGVNKIEIRFADPLLELIIFSILAGFALIFVCICCASNLRDKVRIIVILSFADSLYIYYAFFSDGFVLQTTLWSHSVYSRVPC